MVGKSSARVSIKLPSAKPGTAGAAASHFGLVGVAFASTGRTRARRPPLQFRCKSRKRTGFCGCSPAAVGSYPSHRPVRSCRARRLSGIGEHHGTPGNADSVTELSSVATRLTDGIVMPTSARPHRRRQAPGFFSSRLQADFSGSSHFPRRPTHSDLMVRRRPRAVPTMKPPVSSFETRVRTRSSSDNAKPLPRMRAIIYPALAAGGLLPPQSRFFSLSRLSCSFLPFATASSSLARPRSLK